jgi:hypothetical protein
MLNFTDPNSAISVKFSVLKEVPQFAFQITAPERNLGFHCSYKCGLMREEFE